MNTSDEEGTMLGLIKSKAALGDPEAIQTLEMLRSIGFIKDEPKVVEPKLSEIFDMCVEGARQRKRDYWIRKHTMQQEP